MAEIPGRCCLPGSNTCLPEPEIQVKRGRWQGIRPGSTCPRSPMVSCGVKTHVNRLLAKTGMRDRAQLVGYAFRHRLVTG